MADSQDGKRKLSSDEKKQAAQDAIQREEAARQKEEELQRQLAEAQKETAQASAERVKAIKKATLPQRLGKAALAASLFVGAAVIGLSVLFNNDDKDKQVPPPIDYEDGVIEFAQPPEKDDPAGFGDFSHLEGKENNVGKDLTTVFNSQYSKIYLTSENGNIEKTLEAVRYTSEEGEERVRLFMSQQTYIQVHEARILKNNVRPDKNNVLSAHFAEVGMALTYDMDKELITGDMSAENFNKVFTPDGEREGSYLGLNTFISVAEENHMNLLKRNIDKVADKHLLEPKAP
jgi:hypothetical protein